MRGWAQQEHFWVFDAIMLNWLASNHGAMIKYLNDRLDYRLEVFFDALIYFILAMPAFYDGIFDHLD